MSAESILHYLESHPNISYIALFHEKQDMGLLTKKSKDHP